MHTQDLWAAIPSVNNTGPVLGEKRDKEINSEKGIEGKINPLDIHPTVVTPSIFFFLFFFYHAQIISLQEGRVETPFFKGDKHIECKLPKLHRK